MWEVNEGTACVVKSFKYLEDRKVQYKNSPFIISVRFIRTHSGTGQTKPRLFEQLFGSILMETRRLCECGLLKHLILQRSLFCFHLRAPATGETFKHGRCLEQTAALSNHPFKQDPVQLTGTR